MRALTMLRQGEDKIAARVTERARESLRSGGGLAGAARVAHAELDVATDFTRASGASIACSAGCAFCCHVHVELSVAELEAIVVFVGALEAGKRSAIAQRLTARGEATASLSAEERWAARIPCALLEEDGRCAVYQARPLRCRAFHSRDATTCEDALHGRKDEGPPTVRSLDRRAEAVERGLDRALELAGVDGRPLLLERALATALRERGGGSTAAC